MRSNRVTRQVSFNRSKIGGKCQNTAKIVMLIFDENIVKWDYFLSNFQTLWITKKFIFTRLNSTDQTRRKGERIRRKQAEQLVFYMTHFCCSTCFRRVVRTKTHPKAELKRAKKPFTHMDGRKFLSCRKKLALASS